MNSFDQCLGCGRRRLRVQPKVGARDGVEDCRDPFGTLGMSLRLMAEVLGVGKEGDQARADAGCGRSVLIASRNRNAAAWAASA
jgi:hypothetical protein